MKNKATLYFDPLQMEAVLLTGERLNVPMFRKDLKIFRGVDNTITFNLKDADRMPVKLHNRDLKCIVTNPYTRELMLVKYLFNKDDQKGIYELRLTPGDVQKWSAGFYNFCILMIDINGHEELFYTTLDQDVTGTLELIDKPFPEFVPSFLVKSDDFTMINYNNLAALTNQTLNTVNPITIDFVSSRFPGDAQKNISNSLSTFSILLNNFTGNFWVQGSLEENPITEDAWFNISIDPSTNSDGLSYVGASGIDVFNFVGNYVWIRFKYQVQILNYGSIDKVWLKI